jgi:hypothetical protein
MLRAHSGALNLMHNTYTCGRDVARAAAMKIPFHSRVGCAVLFLVACSSPQGEELRGASQSGLEENVTFAEDRGTPPPVGTGTFTDMMGVNLQYKHGQADLLADLEQAHADGYHYVRIDHPRDFVGTEFGKFDAIVERAKALGVSILLNIMDYSRPAPRSEDERGEWREYLKSLHYYHATRSNPVLFEIWNEPNYEPFWKGSAASGATFGKLMEQAMWGIDFSARWVAEKNPGSRLIPTASGGFIYNCWNQGPAEAFLKDLLQVGSLRASGMSGIGVHPYLWAQGFEPEARRENHEGLVAARNSVGDARPFWATEYGYASSSFDSQGQTVLANGNTPDIRHDFDGREYLANHRQANWNLRSSLIEWSLGTPLATIYAFKDATSSGGSYSKTENEDNFGQYDQYRTLKPSGQVHRFALRRTGTATLDRVFDFRNTASRLNGLKLSTAANTIYIVWASKPGSSATFRIPLPNGKHAAAFNMFGSFQQYWEQAASDTITATVSEDEGPRYFVVE